VSEYFRYIERFSPYTFIFENVPAIADFPLFVDIRNRLTALGYALNCRVVNVARYGVPQRRKRFVMFGSRIGLIPIPEGNNEIVTVRNVIGNLEPPEVSEDYAQTVVSHHTPRIQVPPKFACCQAGVVRRGPGERLIHYKDNEGPAERSVG